MFARGISLFARVLKKFGNLGEGRNFLVKLIQYPCTVKMFTQGFFAFFEKHIH